MHEEPGLPGLPGMKLPIVACFLQALILGPLGHKIMITHSLEKKIPLGLCKISSVLTVPLLLLLYGAAWLINTLDSFQDPLLSPLLREPGDSQAASPSSARGAPLTLADTWEGSGRGQGRMEELEVLQGRRRRDVPFAGTRQPPIVRVKHSLDSPRGRR